VHRRRSRATVETERIVATKGGREVDRPQVRSGEELLSGAMLADVRTRAGDQGDVDPVVAQLRNDRATRVR
jgi:hypothetical protein